QHAKNLGKAGPSEVRHAHRPQPGLAILVSGVDGDDIRVLQLGQGLRLASLGRGALDDHATASQVRLLSQEDACEGAASKVPTEAKVEALIARRVQHRAVGASWFCCMNHWRAL